jgi:hypothetical protein
VVWGSVLIDWGQRRYSGMQNDTEAVFKPNKAVGLTVNTQTIKYSTYTRISMRRYYNDE